MHYVLSHELAPPIEINASISIAFKLTFPFSNNRADITDNVLHLLRSHVVVKTYITYVI